MHKSPLAGLAAIVMAAGLGKRMKSKQVKVLHAVAGRPMILYALDLAARLAGAGTVVVVGHQGEQVKAVIDAHGAAGARGSAKREKGLTAHVGRGAASTPSILIAEQQQQLGTGHAVMQARGAFLRARGAPASTYVILNGDTPLLREGTIRALIRLHESERATVTILTALLDNPAGYGRVVRQGAGGPVLRIVEDRDATAIETAIREINVGTYVVDGSFLFEALDKLAPRNAQREYYLTDIVGLAVERGMTVAAMAAPSAEESLGINTRQQLATAEQIIRREICDRWMEAGVTLRDPATTWIDHDVEIGQDTVIYPNVTLEGHTKIGEDCIIHAQTRMTNSEVGRRVVVQDGCVVKDACLEEGVTIGPFAHLRPGTVLRKGAKVGNFVEIKKTELGEESKANHLSYLGDARIGRGVNIGAGTITCNYDGVHKHETVIEDDVFVGSDSQFVAPVKVGRGAVIAAGSTVTQDVPPDALAVSRAAQVNRPGWAARRRVLMASEGREASDVKREVTLRKPLVPHPSRLTKGGMAKRKTRKAKG
ncbi:MAG: UDP-N-acetylglucosamine diphosphorylase/glucosamine-1-phosphate N-acetyltransferase [Nitrospirae bacterium]|nr:MAG: UDP-N-acetylglucosamine diphosphorylase/glucosamine-1-phosphate N-acetyltransferase [Nitrospirota bacterium]